MPITTDDDDRRGRSRAQVLNIIQANGRERMDYYAGDEGGEPEDFIYLRNPAHLLIRADADLQVRSVIGGTRDERNDPIPGLGLLELEPGMTPEQALSQLESPDNDVPPGSAAPDYALHVTTTATCCPYTEPEPVSAEGPFPELDQNDELGRDVRVSVVDTGLSKSTVRRCHWLEDPVVDGDPESGPQQVDLREYEGHGTFIAGIVRTVARRADIRVEGFLPRGGAVLESEIVKQIYEALQAQMKPHVVSLSAGTYTRNDEPMLGFDALARELPNISPDTVLVAAAGNDNRTQKFYPAAFSWVVGVGAVDHQDRRAEFSNHGDWVDVYALGVDLVNAFPKGHYVCQWPPNKGKPRDFDRLARWSGTSFATPIVAGMIAARVSSTNEKPRDAADVLLKRARFVPKVGYVLRPEPSLYQ